MCCDQRYVKYDKDGRGRKLTVQDGAVAQETTAVVRKLSLLEINMLDQCRRGAEVIGGG